MEKHLKWEKLTLSFLVSATFFGIISFIAISHYGLEEVKKHSTFFFEVTTLVIASWALIVARQHFYDEHEVARRRTAIEATNQWTAISGREKFRLIEYIIGGLNTTECLEGGFAQNSLIQLMNYGRNVLINKELTPYIVTCICPQSDRGCSIDKTTCIKCNKFFSPGNDGNRFILEPEAMVALRAKIAIYFNAFDVVASYWKLRIADRSFLEEAFMEIIFPSADVLSQYVRALKVCDEHHILFPNSWEFVKAIDVKRRSQRAEFGSVGK